MLGAKPATTLMAGHISITRCIEVRTYTDLDMYKKIAQEERKARKMRGARTKG